MSKRMEQALLNKARKDKFIFVLTVPPALREVACKQTENRDNGRVIPETLQFSIQGVVVPPVTVDSGEIRFSGQAVKFSSHSRPSYPDVTVKFKVDNEFNNYWVIWKWIDILNDDKTGVFYDGKDLKGPDSGSTGFSKHRKTKPQFPEESYFGQYIGQGDLYALDEYNNKTIQFHYEGIVPIKVGEINYDYQDADEIESTFQFSFTKLIPKLL